MALLNIDPYIPAGRLKELFHKETGLNLQIKYENEAQDDNTLLGYLGMRSFNSNNKPEPNYLNSNFLKIDYNMPVSTLKHIMIPRCVFSLDVLNDDGIIPDNAKLSDFINDDIKYRSINYKPEVASRINTLNEKLIQIEEDIYTRWCSLKNSLDIDLRNTEHWLNDYEIELSIDYYIDPQDPLYDKNAENLLITMSRQLGKESWHSMINDGQHHDFNIIPSGMKSPVCYLLHDLMEHYHLDSFDIQRIGRIWVDITVCHQHDYRIDIINKDIGSVTGDSPVKVNKNQTFDNFFVCPENIRAHTLSQIYASTSDNLRKSLVIYGDPGTGKTHLLNAIIHLILQNRPDLKIKYITAHNFITDFINSIRSNTQREFKKQFREVDLLIIDDFDIMEKKEETQNEFFFLMNDLLQNNRSVIISSYKNPLKLATLNSRIKATIEHGLISRLQHPDFDSRIEFIDSGLFDYGLELTDFMRTKIAHNIKSISALKGFSDAIKTLHTRGSDITDELIEDEMKNYIQVND